MACSRCAQNAVLSNQKLLHAICGSDFCNQLYYLWVVVSPIASDNQKAAVNSLGDGQENAGDKGLGIVGLLKHCNFLAET